MRLRDKIAIITGGTVGMGRAVRSVMPRNGRGSLL
jgi:NAD(P)-dependent dehydrogenase (short-subunit alcohol dehydrogenase family)